MMSYIKNFMLNFVLFLFCYFISSNLIMANSQQEILSFNTKEQNQMNQNHSSSGVEGKVMFEGSDCPPFSEKEIPPCSGPYSNFNISIYSVDKSKKITTIKTDSDGHYRIYLDPGTYILQSNEENTQAHISENITIKKGEIKLMNYTIKSSIR